MGYLLGCSAEGLRYGLLGLRHEISHCLPSSELVGGALYSLVRLVSAPISESENKMIALSCWLIACLATLVSENIISTIGTGQLLLEPNDTILFHSASDIGTDVVFI